MTRYEHTPIHTYGDQRAVVLREPYWRVLIDKLLPMRSSSSEEEKLAISHLLIQTGLYEDYEERIRRENEESHDQRQG